MDKIGSHFKQEVRHFANLLGRVSCKQKIEDVHQLRVSGRRLRALLWVLQNQNRITESKALKKSLKKLGRKLGDRRQLDVALKDARHFHLKTKKIKQLKKSRGDKLAKFIKNGEPERVLLDLRDLATHLSVKTKSNQIIKNQLRKDLEPWLHSRPKSRLDFHHLRIDAKKVRYVFEALNIPSQNLEKLQDKLGKFHDLQVLKGYTKKNKAIKRAEKKTLKKANKLIRPALESSVEVLKTLH